MTLRIFVPVILGIISVLQAGLNKKAAAKFDLSSAALLNNGVLFAMSFGIFLWFSRPGAAGTGGLLWKDLSPWKLLPGILGILLVAGIPWAMTKWGTTAVFIGLITSQVVTSVLWDKIAEGRPLDKSQIAGAALSFMGVLLMNGRIF